MEKRIVTAHNYPLFEIDVHGFMRRVSLKNILFNIKSLFTILIATRDSKKIIKEFKPDIVIGCGGYVSGPIVRAAAKMGIKTVIQEQNSFPGVTTKLLEKYVDLVFCPDEDSTTHLKHKEKLVVTGNPVKSEDFTSDRNKLREQCSVEDRVFVLSYGGSNGSMGLNRVVAAFMAKHWKTDKVFHVHATGQYAKESFTELMTEYDIDYLNSKNIKVYEFIDNIPSYYAACDLVISRAGALTITELKAAGKASVLIPSPNVTENHQLYNANSLKEINAAYVFEEDSISLEELSDRIMELIDNRDVINEMGRNAKNHSKENASEEIYKHILQLLCGELRWKEKLTVTKG